MTEQLPKIYPCMTCKKDIKLARGDDDSGWDKFNLDGTPHTHPKKNQSQQSAGNVVPNEIGALKQQMSGLKVQVKILIALIEGLRSDVKAATGEA